MTSHGGTNVLSCTHIVFLQSCKRNPGHRGCAFRWHRSVIVGSLCAAVTPIEAPNSVLFWMSFAAQARQAWCSARLRMHEPGQEEQRWRWRCRR